MTKSKQRSTTLAQLTLLLACVVSSGCMMNRAVVAPPNVFNEPPSQQQVIDAINANSAKVQQLHSEDVRLSFPGEMPFSVKATMDYERPLRFRLSGESILGRELDLGSNNDEYWMWVKRNPPPTVYHGRQDQFFESAAQQFLPMPPYWIAEAFGLVYLDPNQPHKMFGQQANGLFEIHSQITTPRGFLYRVLEVDQRQALVKKQMLYDANEQLLASAEASDFRHDPLQNVTLPHLIRVSLPSAGIVFEFQVSNYVINQRNVDPDLWTKPQIPGHRYLDLANPNDMAGVQMMGSPVTANKLQDPYDNADIELPDPSRSAWRRLSNFNSWLR